MRFDVLDWMQEKKRKTEDIVEYRRRYYEKNKMKRNRPLECDNCGTYVPGSYLSQHKKTNKCKLIREEHEKSRWH